MSEGPVLTFKGVSKTYLYSHLGRTTATRGIQGLDLEVRRGETFGLLGLNGSGKTTTFKLALGLLRPSAGEVQVLGGSPQAAAARRGVGYLPELPYFYPYLTPAESLRFYGRLSGLSGADLESRLAEALGTVGLREHAGKRMLQLSKGLAQRVGLAQAVLHDPGLLILDEPVSGLDPLAIAEFRDTLRSLNERGKTLVMSSHSISEAEKLCQRVGILKEGRLVRQLDSSEWVKARGGLEGLFVETVR